MDIKSVEASIQSSAEAAAISWMRQAAGDLTTPRFIWYKPGTIAFHIGPSPLNEDWQKAEETPARNDFTVERMTAHICELARRLPILGATLSFDDILSASTVSRHGELLINWSKLPPHGMSDVHRAVDRAQDERLCYRRHGGPWAGESIWLTERGRYRYDQVHK